MQNTIKRKDQRFRKGSVFDYYGTVVTVIKENRESVCVTSPVEAKPFAVSKALLLEFMEGKDTGKTRDSRQEKKAERHKARKG